MMKFPIFVESHKIPWFQTTNQLILKIGEVTLKSDKPVLKLAPPAA